MSFSEHFASKTPFKNVKEPAKPVKKEEPKETPMSESEKKRMHATQSVTDKSIKEQDYPGQHGVIIGEGAPKMSPFEAGGYEGAADIVGAATYIPTAHMYTDMFNKIGKAAMDIESNIKNKEKSDKMKEWLAKPENAGKGVDSDEYKAYYTQIYGKPPKNNNKYKENKDGTFSLIT